jgi:copper chaperone
MYTFEVQGMTCGHCAKRVTDALTHADPDVFVEIDLATKTVEVESRKPRAELEGVLAQAGYPSSPKPA